MELIKKRKVGQTGGDGNTFLRTKRIEIRVCAPEYNQLEKLATDAGYQNIAQYLRESGLTRKEIVSPSARQKEKAQWLYEVNRIGNNINQIVRRLNQGSQPDDDIFMVLAQIQEIASIALKSALQSGSEKDAS